MIKSKRMQTKTSLIKPKKQISYISIILCVVLLSCIIVPLITMLTKIDSNTFSKVFNDPTFGQSVLNSFLTTLISTLLSIAIAYFLAWAILRTNIKLKSLFSVILILPMLIPSISHGMGLVLLFGNNGFFTRIFSATSHLYGYCGIILGSVLYRHIKVWRLFTLRSSKYSWNSKTQTILFY